MIGSRLAVVALLIACRGSAAPQAPSPDDLDVADPSPPAPAPSSSSPPPAAQEPLAPVARAPRFRGAPIDLDVVDADLHNVFRLLADVGGVSIAVADDVKGTVTLRLRQVPWDQVLETVIKLKKLRLERDGGVYLVTRP